MHPLESFRDALQDSIKKAAKEVIKIEEGEAWIMPDGAVILHDGILPKLLTATDLAAIINHAVKQDIPNHAEEGKRTVVKPSGYCHLPSGSTVYYNSLEKRFYSINFFGTIEQDSCIDEKDIAYMYEIIQAENAHRNSNTAPQEAHRREQTAFEKAIKEQAERVAKAMEEKVKANKTNQ